MGEQPRGRYVGHCKHPYPTPEWRHRDQQNPRKTRKNRTQCGPPRLGEAGEEEDERPESRLSIARKDGSQKALISDQERDDEERMVERKGVSGVDDEERPEVGFEDDRPVRQW